MAFDWREFLLLAHELRNDPRENVRRTCLGRAYYYVYHLGLTKTRQMRWPEPRRSLHRELWGWCQRQTDPTIKQMGTYGLRMHSLRIDADYKDTPIPNLAREVKTQLSRAQGFEGLVAQSNGQAPSVALIP